MSETATTVVPVVDFSDFVTELTYTPYGVAVVVNTILTLGDTKLIPTQMTYNYSKNGLINGVKGAKSYTNEEVSLWINKYLNKRLAK